LRPWIKPLSAGGDRNFAPGVISILYLLPKVVHALFCAIAIFADHPRYPRTPTATITHKKIHTKVMAQLSQIWKALTSAPS